MTLEDMTLLADIMRGRELTQKSLAVVLIDTHRDLSRVDAELKAERLKAQRRLPQRQLEKCVESLEQRLSSKTKALDFSIRRNEVLRQQLADALGKNASRPKHALSRNGAIRDEDVSHSRR